jgi:hypothetical protein
LNRPGQRVGLQNPKPGVFVIQGSVGRCPILVCGTAGLQQYRFLGSHVRRRAAIRGFIASVDTRASIVPDPARLPRAGFPQRFAVPDCISSLFHGPPIAVQPVERLLNQLLVSFRPNLYPSARSKVPLYRGKRTARPLLSTKPIEPPSKAAQRGVVGPAQNGTTESDYELREGQRQTRRPSANSGNRLKRSRFWEGTV